MIPIKMPRFKDLYPKDYPKYFKIIGIRKEKISYELKIIQLIMERNGIDKELIDKILRAVVETGSERINDQLPLPSSAESIAFISAIVDEVLQEELQRYSLDGISINDKGFVMCKEFLNDI